MRFRGGRPDDSVGDTDDTARDEAALLQEQFTTPTANQGAEIESPNGIEELELTKEDAKELLDAFGEDEDAIPAGADSVGPGASDGAEPEWERALNMQTASLAARFDEQAARSDEHAASLAARFDEQAARSDKHAASLSALQSANAAIMAKLDVPLAMPAATARSSRRQRPAAARDESSKSDGDNDEASDEDVGDDGSERELGGDSRGKPANEKLKPWEARLEEVEVPRPQAEPTPDELANAETLLKEYEDVALATFKTEDIMEKNGRRLDQRARICSNPLPMCIASKRCMKSTRARRKMGSRFAHRIPSIPFV
jgi:hypothetical protein